MLRLQNHLYAVVAVSAILWPSFCSAALLSYWTFDAGTYNASTGTFNDTVGSYNGAIGPNASLGAAGVIGAAVDIQGQPGNQYGANATVYSPTNNDIQIAAANKLTIEAWIQPDDIHTNQYSEVIRQQNAYKFLSFQNYGSVLRFNVTDGAIDHPVDAAVSSSTLEDGNWHHIAGTYDGSMLRLYVDGAKVADATATFSIPTTASAADFVIGNLSVGSTYSESFDGRIDEVAIWNEALSNATILSQYTSKAPYATPEPSSVVLAFCGLVGLLAYAWRKRKA